MWTSLYCHLWGTIDNTNIWEEDLESEKSIRYDKNGLVIGATLNKLVERITSTRDHGILEAGRGMIVCVIANSSTSRSRVCQDISVHLSSIYNSREVVQKAA